MKYSSAPLSEFRVNPDTCLLCALVGALAAAVVLALLAKGLFFAPRGPRLLTLDETCNLGRSACFLNLPGGGRLSFVMAPRPIELLKPLALEIHVADSDARPLEVDFTGVNTPMAFNRAYFSPTGNGAYGAQTSLPVCATGRMEWRAGVLLEIGGRQFVAPFRFETERTT